MFKNTMYHIPQSTVSSVTYVRVVQEQEPQYTITDVVTERKINHELVTEVITETITEVGEELWNSVDGPGRTVVLETEIKSLDLEVLDWCRTVVGEFNSILMEFWPVLLLSILCIMAVYRCLNIIGKDIQRNSMHLM